MSDERDSLVIPKFLGQTPPERSETALAADTERILRALEQGKRATMRPMPTPRTPPDRDSARSR